MIHFIFPRFSSKNPGPSFIHIKKRTRPLLFLIQLVIYFPLFTQHKAHQKEEENNFIQAFDATLFRDFFSSVTSWRTMRFILDTVTACRAQFVSKQGDVNKMHLDAPDIKQIGAQWD